jgi:Tfp pilus assembly protein PilF
MKPRFLCSECQNELQWGAESCPACGQPVEWPEESASEASAAVSGDGGITCPVCGTENSSSAEFCSSCGAKLKSPAGSGKRQAEQPRKGTKSGGQRNEKKNRDSTGSLFSSKIIFGVLGLVAVLVIVFEVMSTRDQQATPTTSAPSTTAQAPAANMQLINQIADLEKRVAANPNDLQSLITLANVCQDGRFFDKAIVHYRKYLEKSPKDANARVDMGICFFETSNLEEARKEMELALKYDPKHVPAHFNLGIVNLRAGKVKEANEWFKKTIALAPNSDMGQQAKQILEQHSSPLLQTK